MDSNEQKFDCRYEPSRPMTTPVMDQHHSLADSQSIIDQHPIKTPISFQHSVVGANHHSNSAHISSSTAHMESSTAHLENPNQWPPSMQKDQDLHSFDNFPSAQTWQTFPGDVPQRREPVFARLSYNVNQSISNMDGKLLTLPNQFVKNVYNSQTSTSSIGYLNHPNMNLANIVQESTCNTTNEHDYIILTNDHIRPGQQGLAVNHASGQQALSVNHTSGHLSTSNHPCSGQDLVQAAAVDAGLVSVTSPRMMTATGLNASGLGATRLDATGPSATTLDAIGLSASGQCANARLPAPFTGLKLSGLNSPGMRAESLERGMMKKETSGSSRFAQESVTNAAVSDGRIRPRAGFNTKGSGSDVPEPEVDDELSPDLVLDHGDNITDDSGEVMNHPRSASRGTRTRKQIEVTTAAHTLPPHTLPPYHLPTHHLPPPHLPPHHLPPPHLPTHNNHGVRYKRRSTSNLQDNKHRQNDSNNQNNDDDDNDSINKDYNDDNDNEKVEEESHLDINDSYTEERDEKTLDTDEVGKNDNEERERRNDENIESEEEDVNDGEDHDFDLEDYPEDQDPNDQDDDDDEDFEYNGLPETEVDNEEPEVESNIRRSRRKRKCNVNYGLEYMSDVTDLDDLEETEVRAGSNKKKRKSSKPHRVTQTTEAWPETETDDGGATFTPGGGKRKLNYDKARAAPPVSKYSIHFGNNNLQKFVKLKTELGVSKDSTFLTRLLSCWQNQVDVHAALNQQTNQNTQPTFKLVHGKKAKQYRHSIHDDDVTDDLGNLQTSEGSDPAGNVCIRTSADIKRCWAELCSRTQMTSSHFLAHLLLVYCKSMNLDMAKDSALVKADEQRGTEFKSDLIDICSCEPKPDTDNSESDKRKRKPKTKEDEQIDERDYIIHHVKQTVSNPVPIEPSQTNLNSDKISTDRVKFSKYYECATCNKWYKTWNIFYHLRQHKDKDYLCPDCGCQKPIRQPKRLKEEVKCSYCEFTSFYAPVMKSHIKSQHAGSVRSRAKIYACNECGRAMNNASALREHRLSHHPGDAGFVCNVCQKSFNNRRFLRVHMLGVHGNRSFVCDHKNCTRKFNTKNMLATHVKRVHLRIKKVNCSFSDCDKKFFSRCELAQHMRVYHTKEKCFICSWSNCGKTFRAPYHLQVHMRIHTDEKPLKCDYCDYRARQRNALNWHLRKHGVGPHVDKIPSKTRVRDSVAKQKVTQVSVQIPGAQVRMDNNCMNSNSVQSNCGSDLQVAAMYAPQFEYVHDVHNRVHATHTATVAHSAFAGVETLYHAHAQLPAFPQAIAHGTHLHHLPHTIQYQPL